MATYKLSWLFLRSLEQGCLSLLGLAQSAGSFPATNTFNRDTQDLVPSRLTVVQTVCLRRTKKKKAVECGSRNGLRDTLLRGLKAAVQRTVPFGRTANGKGALERSMRIAYSTRSLIAVPVREGCSVPVILGTSHSSLAWHYVTLRCARMRNHRFIVTVQLQRS